MGDTPATVGGTAANMAIDPTQLPPLTSIWDDPMIETFQVTKPDGRLIEKWRCMFCQMEYAHKHASKGLGHVGQVPFPGMKICQAAIPEPWLNRYRALIQLQANKKEARRESRNQMREEIMQMEVCPFIFYSNTLCP